MGLASAHASALAWHNRQRLPPASTLTKPATPSPIKMAGYSEPLGT
jgi:hypothetical protein